MIFLKKKNFVFFGFLMVRTVRMDGLKGHDCPLYGCVYVTYYHTIQSPFDAEHIRRFSY